jgi:4-amino-4-deoxy-L-arabinose transferase-like glycosyltransferase
MRTWARHTFHHTYLFELAALFGLVALGLIIGGDYGLSIDEPGHLAYARQTAEVYSGALPIEKYSPDPGLNGPFYTLGAYEIGQVITRLRPGWLAVDGRHFAYYLALILATASVWILVRRYVSKGSAWLVAALFITQPVLFGHAFINPKDIPFLGFFIAGLSLGVLALPQAREARLVDSSQAQIPSAPRPLLILTGVGILLVAILWLRPGLFPAAQSVLEAAYQGHAPAMIQRLFDLFATDAWKTPLALYQAKLNQALALVRYVLSLSLGFALLLPWGLRLYPRPDSYPHSQTSLALTAASGVMLGLDTSIRAIAPIGLLPLAFLFILAYRKRSIFYLAVLIAAAAAACFVSWPFVWIHPIPRFIQAVQTLIQFPWTGDIQFNGQLLNQGQQPWFYLPELMLLQLTLPALALAGLGVWVWLRRLSRKSMIEIAAVSAAMALPVAATFQPGSIVYNNFRQFLFTLPAIFLLAGLGVSWLSQRFPRRLTRAALASLSLLPAIIGILRLHPYEYVYYNALAGPPASVATRFETDYWCTSYRQAIEWIDTYAPQRAVITFGPDGKSGQLQPFARGDLEVVHLHSSHASHAPDFIIECGLSGTQPDPFPGAPILMRVEQAGYTLAEVKDLRPPR